MTLQPYLYPCRPKYLQKTKCRLQRLLLLQRNKDPKCLQLKLDVHQDKTLLGLMLDQMRKRQLFELLNFLPRLDNGVKNPDAWIECLDEDDISWKLRYIHYNNKFHDEGGTRDEYRITHIMPFLRKMGAMTGDIFHIKRDSFVGPYIISIEEKEKAEPVGGVIKVKLSGWNKVC